MVVRSPFWLHHVLLEAAVSMDEAEEGIQEAVAPAAG